MGAYPDTTNTHNNHPRHHEEHDYSTYEYAHAFTQQQQQQHQHGAHLNTTIAGLASEEDFISPPASTLVSDGDHGDHGDHDNEKYHPPAPPRQPGFDDPDLPGADLAKQTTQVDNCGYEIEELPGTSLLVRDKGSIILSPHPTTSPNDPLNWAGWRKWWHTLLVCFIAGFTAATSNDAGSAQFGEREDLGISYGAMNTGAGVLFLGIGYGTLAISPAAWLWGRRSSYLFCILMGMVGSIWMARTQTTNDSIFCQLFVGISESCAEANVQLSLSDLFFEHQRGTVLSIYVLATSMGTFLGPMIASFIADSPQRWRWIGWWAVIISAGTLVVLYFGLEETMFDRPSHEANSTNAGDASDASSTVINLETGEREKK
ncbi:hypothetical protein KEM52_003050, partial [Ascosphaera acerosa]